MWNQFFLINIHFAINLFGALVFFSVFWLYFDAWIGRRNFREAVKLTGFILLCLSFIFSAIRIDSSILPAPLLSESINLFLLFLTRILGFTLLIVSLLVDPLIPKPKQKQGIKAIAFTPKGFLQSVVFVQFLFPILSVLTGLLYLRRATIGLENHLKQVALSFFVLGAAEILSLGFLFQNTQNVSLYNIVAPFGTLWIAAQIVYLISFIILGRWAISYLLKRFQSQLFMLFTTSILIIFLITTVTFSALLVRQLQEDTILHLSSDVKVLGFAIESKNAEVLSDAQVLSQNDEVIKNVNDASLKNLFEISQNFLLSKKESLVTIVDKNGQVLARGDDRERIKDSLSDDPVIKKALKGESASSVISRDGVLAPEISVRAATPIKDGEEIVGAVLVGTVIDNAFVDGVKAATGLEASVYADNKISATTLLSPDGKTRLLGIVEEDKNIKNKVLLRGESFSGSIALGNIPYFSAYTPLKDINGNPVGMLFVGKKQIGVLQAIATSIEFTFLISAILLVLSIFPAYIVSRYIANQLK